MWTSFTSVCASASRVTQAIDSRVSRQYWLSRRNWAKAGFFRSTNWIGSQGRTGEPLRTKAFGRDDRRRTTGRAIETSMPRMLAQLLPGRAENLSNFRDKIGRAHV